VGVDDIGVAVADWQEARTAMSIHTIHGILVFIVFITRLTESEKAHFL